MNTLLAVLLGLVGAIYCATIMPGHHHQHHHTGPTVEPNEFRRLSFFYDHVSHYLIAKMPNACYFLSLSADDQAKVHSPAGMTELELGMIQMINGNEDTLTTDALLHLPGPNSHHHGFHCDNRTLYKVGNLVVATPTPVIIEG